MPDALDWDWGMAGVPPSHQNQSGEHLPCLFPGPGQVGSSCLARRLPQHEGRSSAPQADGESLSNHEGRTLTGCQRPADAAPQTSHSCSLGTRGPGGVPESPCTLGCPPLPTTRVVMAACRVGVAGTNVSPTTGDAGSPRRAGGQAGSYFRHCPIWTLPEPKRRGLTAIPTPYCQQLLFKDGQRPDTLLTGQPRAPMLHPPPQAHHSLGKSSSQPCILLLLHLQEPPRSRDGSWHATVSGTWPGSAVKNHLLAHAQLQG